MITERDMRLFGAANSKRWRRIFYNVHHTNNSLWLILDLGQNVDNFKRLNFRSGTFYKKVYKMKKYLQHTYM